MKAAFGRLLCRLGLHAWAPSHRPVFHTTGFGGYFEEVTVCTRCLREKGKP